MESGSAPQAGAAAAGEELGAVPARSARALGLAARLTPPARGLMAGRAPLFRRRPPREVPPASCGPRPLPFFPSSPLPEFHTLPPPSLFTPSLLLLPSFPFISIPSSPSLSCLHLLHPISPLFTRISLLFILFSSSSTPPAASHPFPCTSPLPSAVHYPFLLHPITLPCTPFFTPSPHHFPSRLPCFLYSLSPLIPLLFLFPAPPSFSPSFVNRDERNPGLRPPPPSSSLPGSRSRGPRLQRPTWERLRAPSLGHSWQLERSQFSKGLALLG